MASTSPGKIIANLLYNYQHELKRFPKIDNYIRENNEVCIRIMNKKIEKHNTKTALLSGKKVIDKSWEDELDEWIIEEFFTPYQAS